MATLYVLHFNRPYWMNCRHYVGYTSLPLERRLEAHRSGRGSLLVRYALKQGCDFEVAYQLDVPTAAEARRIELRIKKLKRMPQTCPLCQARRSPRPRSSRR